MLGTVGNEVPLFPRGLLRTRTSPSSEAAPAAMIITVAFREGVNYYDLTAAVAGMPEKDVAKAEKVLKTFLRLVDRAEGRGLTLRKKHAKLSTKDAQKIRRKVKASFLRWANS